jgi:hypothetical protein
MKRKAKPPPPPGSDEAIALGCTCPVLDNRERPVGFKVFVVGCPVHCPPRARTRSESRRLAIQLAGRPGQLVVAHHRVRRG